MYDVLLHVLYYALLLTPGRYGNGIVVLTASLWNTGYPSLSSQTDDVFRCTQSGGGGHTARWRSGFKQALPGRVFYASTAEERKQQPTSPSRFIC